MESQSKPAAVRMVTKVRPDVFAILALTLNLYNVDDAIFPDVFCHAVFAARQFNDADISRTPYSHHVAVILKDVDLCGHLLVPQ
tara:strand:- start:203 stop:454 length:252 start_codon:yes stop_codon:yes gene_type:complete